MALTLVQAKEGLIQTKPQFEAMAINGIDFAKEMQYAVMAFQSNPKLLACSQETVLNCLINVALSSLSLSPVMKLAYLVPRDGKCCLDPSYMGLLKIVTDSGSVKSLKANVVYSNEKFEMEQGSNGYVVHKPNFGPDGRGKRIGAYSIAKLADGTEHIEFMYEQELMAIKKRSKAQTGPWSTDEDEMCKKTVIKRQWKQLPKSERMEMVSQAIAFDDETNGIDFKKEQLKLSANNNSNFDFQATPGVEAVEMCNQEAFDKIIKALEDPALGELFSDGKLAVATTKTSLEKRYNDGKLTAQKAFEWDAYLTSEVNKALAKAQAEPAP